METRQTSVFFLMSVSVKRQADKNQGAVVKDARDIQGGTQSSFVSLD